MKHIREETHQFLISGSEFNLKDLKRIISEKFELPIQILIGHVFFDSLFLEKRSEILFLMKLLKLIIY